MQILRQTTGETREIGTNSVGFAPGGVMSLRLRKNITSLPSGSSTDRPEQKTNETNKPTATTSTTPSEEVSFLEALGALSRARRLEPAMKLIVRWCNDQFQDGSFNRVGRALEKLEPSALDPNLLVGFLAATYAASRQLAEQRTLFAGRIRPTLEASLGTGPVSRIYSRLG